MNWDKKNIYIYILCSSKGIISTRNCLHYSDKISLPYEQKGNCSGKKSNVFSALLTACPKKICNFLAKSKKVSIHKYPSRSMDTCGNKHSDKSSDSTPLLN